ncbi:MAG: alpha-hydroxy-acid oxidizing protein [Spirochaetales bacterium]|jgi:isopentenyl diphosphate isomerase/L-lactate dehydrogenase-like FMN-dependent dehydrogenase|nr:alpha-hydroxy-acid oxidizing protein [Spirochaetales bacterium]
MAETEGKFPTNLEDIEALAYKAIADKGHPERSGGWTHRKGGVETGSTWRRAKDIYESIGLKMRAINSLKYNELDITTKFAGQPISLPVSIAPMIAGINFVCDKPFEQIAKAAARMNVAAGIGYPSGPLVYGGMAALAKTFRIVKPVPEKETLIAELQKSIEAGCCAAGIDIDSIGGMKPVGDEVRFAELARPYGKDELAEIRSKVPGKFILKGVMSAEDARDAADIGADAIIVSTHVGYCLDYSPAPLEALPEIKAATGGKVEIIVDSGITRGTDIIKAIALGADSILVGRLTLWGLLIDGADGVEHMFRRLEAELRRAMILMGAPSLKALSPKNLVPLDGKGERILRKTATL